MLPQVFDETRPEEPAGLDHVPELLSFGFKCLRMRWATEGGVFHSVDGTVDIMARAVEYTVRKAIQLEEVTSA